MKTFCRLSLHLAFLAASLCFTSCIVTSGITGPVYATDTDFPLRKVSGTATANDTIFTLAAGLKYRIVSVEGGSNYIKMMGRTKYRKTTAPIVMENKQGRPAATAPAAPTPTPAASTFFYIDVDNRNHVLFEAQEKDIKPYQRIVTAQVAIGTMLLPIKIRGPIDHNNTHYERQFSTDISLGPFIGYRFKFSGNNYKTFTTIGGFAGPTLINYVSSTSQTGSPTPASTTPDNMFAFTYGIGLVHEINSFQIGLVYGTDRVSGNRVKDWPYDGRGWFSLGIGYNFITAR